MQIWKCENECFCFRRCKGFEATDSSIKPCHCPWDGTLHKFVLSDTPRDTDYTTDKECPQCGFKLKADEKISYVEPQKPREAVDYLINLKNACEVNSYYTKGMFNGLELALAFLEKRTPRTLYAPEYQLKTEIKDDAK